MSIESDKLQPGKCRYAMPWNPCNNQKGDTHHAECVNHEEMMKKLTKEFLIDNQWDAAIFAHDILGQTWVNIFKSIKY